jgi:hypothetical protein
MRSAILLGTCALLALQVGNASAGPCTGEIESLSRTLASTDAGSGPTAGATANPGQHPPTAAMAQADPSTTASSLAAKSNQPQHPPTAAMNTAAANLAAGPEATRKPREEHPPTAAMNQATQGSAASPEDVQRQTSGRPTAAQQAQGASPGAASDKAAASAALEQARNFDKTGEEARCLEAVQRAKRLAGP